MGALVSVMQVGPRPNYLGSHLTDSYSIQVVLPLPQSNKALRNAMQSLSTVIRVDYLYQLELKQCLKEN